MSFRDLRCATRLSNFSRLNAAHSKTRTLSSTTRAWAPTENETRSEEPLAQRLNIDDPESGDIRAKTQAAQSKTENTTEPLMPDATGDTAQPTQEPVAQRQNKDEPPTSGLRGKTHEAMHESENTRET